MRSRARLRAPLCVVVTQLATGCATAPTSPPAAAAVEIGAPAASAAPAAPEASTDRDAPPGTAAPAAPADADGDGIPDGDDRCLTEPETAKGNQPRDGCPDRVVISPANPPPPPVVLFDAGSAAVQRAAAPILDEVAATMQAHPEVLLVEVEGHTDTAGSKRAELSVSELRAQAVRAALIGRGVDASRLRAKGYGSFCPMAPNDKPSNRAKNRRVRFVLVKTTSGPTDAAVGCEPAAAAGVKPDPVP